MARRLTAIMVLVGLVLCLCGGALAATPKNPTDATTQFIRSEMAGAANPEYVMQIPDLPLEQVVLEVEKINTFITEEKKPVVQYFAEEVQEKIAELAPASLSINSLELNELISLSSVGFKAEQGVTEGWFDFETDYQEEQFVVAVVMIYDAQGVALYVPQVAQVVGGLVDVTFTPETLAAMEGAPIGMAILNDPLPTPAPTITPSKTTDDMDAIAEVVTAQENPAFELVISETLSEEAAAEIDRLYQFVSTNNQSPAMYYNESIREQMAGLLPDGVLLGDLQLNEFVSLEMRNFSEAQGDTIASFRFATQYQDGQPVVASVVIFGLNGETTTVPLKAEVEGGLVKVLFPQDMLVRMATHPFALAVLSQPV